MRLLNWLSCWFLFCQACCSLLFLLLMKNCLCIQIRKTLSFWAALMLQNLTILWIISFQWFFFLYFIRSLLVFRYFLMFLFFYKFILLFFLFLLIIVIIHIGIKRLYFSTMFSDSLIIIKYFFFLSFNSSFMCFW